MVLPSILGRILGICFAKSGLLRVIWVGLVEAGDLGRSDEAKGFPLVKYVERLGQLPAQVALVALYLGQGSFVGNPIGGSLDLLRLPGDDAIESPEGQRNPMGHCALGVAGGWL